MRSSSAGRKSSTNPSKVLSRQPSLSSSDGSHIPRPRFRSSSSDRVSSIRRSNLKVPVKLSLLQTPVQTPQAGRLHCDLPTGSRPRSPSADRASALGTNNALKKDTRPLNDKSYQTAMLHRIDQFFKDANQSAVLGASNSLRPVSLKNFVAATDLLLTLLGVKQHLTQLNYTEELPKIAKKIHYPGIISKSWLKTANAPHSWPQVLGWISWLVEICEATDIARKQFSLEYIPILDDDDGEAINRNQLQQMFQLYAAWNEGNDAQESALKEKYVQNTADQCGLNEEDVQAAEDEANESKKKYEAVMKEYETVQEESNQLRAKLDALLEDEKKLIAYENEQIEFLRSEELAIETLNSEFDYLNKEIEKHVRQQKELNEIIKEQPMAVEERDEIIKKCSELKSYIVQLDDHISDIQKNQWALEMKCCRMTDELSKAILAYNRDITINITSSTEFTMPDSGLGANPNITAFLNEKVEAMTHFVDSLKKDIHSRKLSIEVETHRLELLQEQKKIIDQREEEWLSKNDEVKLSIKNLKLRAQKEEKSLRRGIKKIENDIKELKNSFPDIDLIESELDEAKEKLEALIRRKAFLEKSAEGFFHQINEVLAQDRVELVKTIKELED